MKTLVYIITILLTSAICSCRPSQNLTTDTSKDYSKNFDLLMQQIDSVTKSMTMNQKEIFSRISNLKVDNKTVVYSLPDSLGRQYPIKESTTTVNKEDKEDRQTYTQIEEEIKQLSSSFEKLKTLVESSISKNTEKIELSWWNLHKDKVYIFIIILMLVALFYKYIKNKIS